MNSSANTSDHQGDPNWATGNWDQSGAIGSLDQAAHQYTANRLDWEWDPMILAQHPGSGGSNDYSDVDCKNHLAAGGTMSNLRTYNMLSGLPPNFTQTNMGMYNSAGIWNYGGLEALGNLHPSTSTIQNVLGSSGIPGLAPTGRAGLHSDLRSSFDDQRHREFYGGMQQNAYMVNDGHGARLGLNLGVRTYFSTEDIVVGRLGKRHRAGSPGSQVPMCQAEGCKADLSTAQHYHRRHKVCSLHSKASNVVVAGRVQRFCQQCSRFHFLPEFDDGKRSCRKRLADHNRRRRKPQLSALTCDAAVECIGMKGEEDSDLSGSPATDSKSMLLHPKNSGSPSSVSPEDSDEQPASAKNNVQLHTPGATFGRVPKEDQHSSQPGMQQMSSQPMRGPEAQATLVSAMSLSATAPLMLHNTKHQPSMMPGKTNHSQDAMVHQQQYLQGVNASQSGPSLSLSSLGGQGHQPGICGQPMLGQTYNAPAVPWLRNITSQGSDLGQVVGRPGVLNLQHLLSTDSKAGQSPHRSVTTAATNANSQDPDAQVFSASDKNLLPLQTSSGDIAGPEWMLGRMTGQPNPGGEQKHFGPSSSSSLNNLSGSGQLEGQQMLALLETSTLRPGECENPSGAGDGQHVQDRQTPMEFLQEHKTGTESGEDHSTQTLRSSGSPDLKYAGLHAVRPCEPSSIYDSHNLL
ncbi:unnamed protein product [Sphagnum jensenii]|uniref:SBP-type domain-containing protein n=1 Tax=Sphagnum jensenii TaxID=128206 RepID=A0ABP0VXC9_9BRYO